MEKEKKNFSGRDLRGQSFKNQDLADADFSDCDLRGVDFSGADLTAAKFCRAKMGRTLKHNLAILPIKFLIGCIAGYSIPKNNIVFVNWISSDISIDKTLLTHLLHLYLFALGAALVIDCNNRRLKYSPWFLSSLIAVLWGFNFMTTGSSLIASAVFTMSVAAIITITEFSAILIAIAGVFTGVIAITLEKNQFLQGTDAGILFSCFALYLIYDADQKKEPLKLFHSLGTRLNGWGGSTQFAFATLKNVDFSHADLKYARFKDAIIEGCQFHHAKNSDLSITDTTPLEVSKVRKLMMTGAISDKNFANLDLRGLDFSGLDLHEFNFANANLSFANFSGCNLKNANLSEVNAVGTCFNETQMTGACIKNWNIDTRTELNNIECDYVFLAENQQQRNPPEDVFATGEFSKLYQHVADTIDFIVHSRAELEALSTAIEMIRVEADNEEIFVQSIERKENSIVVKLKAPPEFDRQEVFKKVKQLQGELEQANRLSQDKSLYIGSAAHDLKNEVVALESILRNGCTTLAKNNTVIATESIDDVTEIAKSMRAAFDSIMEMSRLESGKVKMRRTDFDLCALVKQVINELTPFAVERKVSLLLSNKLDVKVIVNSDYHHFKRVLVNLVTNGIKYADFGKNDLAVVAIVIATYHPHYIRLDVIDNGIGIPEEEHEAIFAPHYQLNNPENNENKGIGLGLSIVRHIFHLLGDHSIKLQSKPNVGTRFSLKLPRGS